MCAAGMAGLAGCGGGDGGDGTPTDTSTGGDDSEMDDDMESTESAMNDTETTESETESMDDTETTETETESMDDGGSATDAFSYTFGDGDDVVGSSLTGTAFDYPDGSGAVSDATVESATLGGTNVGDDLTSSSTSNNGDTLTLDFGGNYQIQSGDEMAVELAGVSGTGSYTVEVTVNPQSGATTFSQSF